MKIFSITTFVLIMVGATMLALVLWREQAHRLGPIESLASMQGADAPLFLPQDGEPRHRLHAFDAWQLASIPAAHRFDGPLGSESGGLSCNREPFWAFNEERGGHHTGDDLDGLGGGDTDLGDPVFAIADGMVVFAGEASPEQGKTLVVSHQTKDGRRLQSVYAHLHRMDLPLGALVARGQRIGLVGTARGHQPAHLHFELRQGDGVDIGPGYDSDRLNRLDPEETVMKLRGTSPDRPSPSLLPVALEREAMWNDLEIENAGKLGDFAD